MGRWRKGYPLKSLTGGSYTALAPQISAQSFAQSSPAGAIGEHWPSLGSQLSNTWKNPVLGHLRGGPREPHFEQALRDPPPAPCSMGMFRFDCLVTRRIDHHTNLPVSHGSTSPTPSPGRAAVMCGSRCRLGAPPPQLASSFLSVSAVRRCMFLFKPPSHSQSSI